MKMRLILFFLMVSMASVVFPLDTDYTNYNQLLRKTVCGSSLDYQKLAKDPLYNVVKKEFEAVTKSQYQNLSEKNKLAFLLNLYNFQTIVILIDNPPLKKSIREIPQVWDKKFISFMGGKVSLNEIEHTILRKQFNEPRIHFALVCASISCPSLANYAFTGNKLESQLQIESKKFLSDVTKNKITKAKMELSQIFQWYGDDFKSRYGSYVDYIKKSLNLNGDYSVNFLPYNWQLNNASCR